MKIGKYLIFLGKTDLGLGGFYIHRVVGLLEIGYKDIALSVCNSKTYMGSY